MGVLTRGQNRCLRSLLTNRQLAFDQDHAAGDRRRLGAQVCASTERRDAG